MSSVLPVAMNRPYCDLARPHGSGGDRISYARLMTAAPTQRAAARPAPARLSPAIPARARLHVVTGKGGTGKTTAAVALALALVELGRKVLVVEVEGRQALAQLFDVPALPYEERRLVAGTGNGSLWGLADRRRTGDDRVPRHVLRAQAFGARAEEDGRGRLRHHARAGPA